MKNLVVLALPILLILTSCGGVGTEPTSAKSDDADKVKLEQELAKNKGCSEDVKDLIEAVAELCASDMNVDINRTLCLVKARGLVSKHPDFVCSLESGLLVDSDYIQENFIDKVETQKDKLKNSGIFDD